MASCGGSDTGSSHNSTPAESVPASEFPMLTGADSAALCRADSLAYLYWEHPSSPSRDEGRYIRFLNELLRIDSLPEALRMRAEERLRTASLNRPGSVAADFGFLCRDGSSGTLHAVNAPAIMLIFYDPECPHCSDILDAIAADRLLASMIAGGEIKVVAVYAEGKKEVWTGSNGDLPPEWIVGYDTTGILEHELYDLPAMPVIYMLDGAKRVLFKDPDSTSIHKILRKIHY